MGKVLKHWIDSRDLDFAGVKTRLPCILETTIDLKSFGKGQTARVITTLPRWNKVDEWTPTDQFVLNIITNLLVTKMDAAMRASLSQMLADLQEAFGKLNVYGKKDESTVQITPMKAKLGPEKYAEAAANHLMAVEILKKY